MVMHPARSFHANISFFFSKWKVMLAANICLFTAFIFHVILFNLSLLTYHCILCKFTWWLFVVVDGGKVVLRGKKLEHVDGEVVIIGGMVLDIHATPSVRANSGTTVPGKVVIYFIWKGKNKRSVILFCLC